jgi:hypothetical protein
MTVESRIELFGVHVPFTKRAEEPGKVIDLEKEVDGSLIRRLTVFTPNKVALSNFWLDDETLHDISFLETDRINDEKILSSGLITRHYYWKP